MKNRIKRGLQNLLIGASVSLLVGHAEGDVGRETRILELMGKSLYPISPQEQQIMKYVSNKRDENFSEKSLRCLKRTKTVVIRGLQHGIYAEEIRTIGLNHKAFNDIDEFVHIYNHENIHAIDHCGNISHEKFEKIWNSIPKDNYLKKFIEESLRKRKDVQDSTNERIAYCGQYVLKELTLGKNETFHIPNELIEFYIPYFSESVKAKLK